MQRTNARLAAWALIAGTILATGGYLAAFLRNGNDDARFAGSSWVALYTVALFGDVLVILGLPALLHAHGERSRTLTLIGYVGLFVPLVILNIGEGTIEGFVKPYFATHGGLPADDVPGLGVFEAPALVILLGGLICLGIAVFRARTLPRWVGVAFVLAPLLAVAGLPGAAGLISDYVAFAGLFAVGVHNLRATRQPRPATTPAPLAATA